MSRRLAILASFSALVAVNASAASDPCAQGGPDCRLQETRLADASGAAGVMTETELRSARAGERGGDYRRRIATGAADAGVRQRSVYGGFGNAVFARAGTVFAAGINDGDLDAMGLSGTAGYRRSVSRTGRGVLWVEPAIVYFSDSEEQLVNNLPIETTFSGLGGIVSLGYAYDFGGFGPFATIGAGPLNIRTEVDDGVLPVSVSELTVGYAGVAGIQARIVDDVSFEAAYRYLGSVRTDVIGLHSVEVGVSYRF